MPDSSSVPPPPARDDDGGPVLPQPRRAPDDASAAELSAHLDLRRPDSAPPPDVSVPVSSASPVGRPGARPTVSTPRVYADGSALSRYLDGAPCRAQWLAWAAQHEDELITTPLGLTELRRIARPRGVEANGVAHDVEDRVEVVRFSDQTLRAATKVSGVLPAFIALHLGVALAHPGVGGVATYDVQLAQASALHGLTVVSPGWPALWWERAG